MQGTVHDVMRLLQATGSVVMLDCRDHIDPLVEIIQQPPAATLSQSMLHMLWPVLPLILGNKSDAPATAPVAAMPWFHNDAAIAETIAEIEIAHPLGSLVFTSETNGVWAPAGLFTWFDQPLFRMHKRRWLLVPEFPIPILQVFVPTPIELRPQYPSELRKPLIDPTLEGLRIRCSPWAHAFSWPSATLGQVLSIGGFDALTASALLLHRGACALDGWILLRQGLGLSNLPGWSGAVLDRFGKEGDGLLRYHNAWYAWLTAPFECTLTTLGRNANAQTA